MSKVDGRSSALDLSAPTFKAFHLERMILITFDPLRPGGGSLSSKDLSSEFDRQNYGRIRVYMCVYTYCNTLSYIYFHRYNGSRVHLSFRTTLIFRYDVTIVFAPFVFCGFGMEVSSNTGFAPFIPPRQW